MKVTIAKEKVDTGENFNTAMRSTFDFNWSQSPGADEIAANARVSYT